MLPVPVPVPVPVTVLPKPKALGVGVDGLLNIDCVWGPFEVPIEG